MLIDAGKGIHVLLATLAEIGLSLYLGKSATDLNACLPETRGRHTPSPWGLACSGIVAISTDGVRLNAHVSASESMNLLGDGAGYRSTSGCRHRSKR